MANVKHNAAARETCRRLLEAAGEVFADQGFHGATIKAITDRAGASIAAVNYHFSDKASLYTAVLERIAEDAVAILPPPGDPDATSDAELRRMIQHICRTMIGRGQRAWERILLAREFAQVVPTIAPLRERVVEPLTAQMARPIADLIGTSPDDERVTLTVISILAQCVYYLMHGAHLEQLYPTLPGRPDHDVIADHVTAFSMHAIAGLARES